MGFLSQFDSFHEQAIAATGGLTDFGDSDYHEPLKILLDDYDKYTRFSEIGIKATEGDIVGHLIARLVEEHRFKLFPQYLETPIKRPIFMVGMTRTGTTRLQRLIALDPAVQHLPLWLGAMPEPRPPRETWDSNPVYIKVKEAFDEMDRLNPRIREIHPMIAGDPDECHTAMTRSFHAINLASLATVPNYAEWLKHADRRPAYRRYRKTLGLIAAGSTDRWVLKDPTHLWTVPAILDVFPDACLIITHRDPVKTIPSIMSLVYEVRTLREPEFKPADLGNFFVPYWGCALDRAEKERAGFNPAQVIDLHFNEVIGDPMGSLERIYDHFGFPISDAARARWAEDIKNDTSGGRNPYVVTPEQFGSSAAQIHECAGHYMERFRAIDAAQGGKRGRG